ncbi:MAG: isochorismatase family protein [Candidatus Coatesbacteria bacterium]|nr:isochorismatase family protein [Candidatus Coatesbacteria bacterium]
MSEGNRIAPAQCNLEKQVVAMIIDHQERLLSHINGKDEMLRRACKLVGFCRLLSIPTIITEQYPAGLGPTSSRILQMVNPDVPILEKTTFSCMRDSGISAALGSLDRECVVVSGIETHICVSQTVFGLLERSHIVYVLADCVGSRNERDHLAALERMRDSGAVITTLEAFMYEVLVSSGHPKFKEFHREIMS